MKKNSKNLLRSRRGVTMAEVAIALVIIGIISAAALSVVMYSVNVEKQSFAVIQAENAAESAVACFRYAESKDEFFDALCKTGDYEQLEDGSFRCITNGCTVTVRADYSQQPYFEYNAVNADGEQIYSFRYPNSPSEGGASQ